MICEGPCGLELPDRIVFKCDGHCDKKLCIRCIRPHAQEVSMTYRVIPKMIVESKRSQPVNAK